VCEVRVERSHDICDSARRRLVGFCAESVSLEEDCGGQDCGGQDCGGQDCGGQDFRA